MKYGITLLLLFSSVLHAADAQLAKDVGKVKQAVLELNRDLYQLEQDLLSPSTTQIAFYFSLQGGKYFTPLALEIHAEGLAPMHHLYTEREVQALKMGAVQPVGLDNIGPGARSIEVIVRGLNVDGEEQQLNFKEEVEKTAAPLLLEISVQDKQKYRQAMVQLQKW